MYHYQIKRRLKLRGVYALVEDKNNVITPEPNEYVVFYYHC